jgi:hypothetical protein
MSANMSQRDGRPTREATSVAENAVDAWRNLAKRLTPIIGEQGFHVLYARSLHLTRSAFPSLASLPVQSDATESYLASLKQSLEREQPTLAEDAHRALLLTFSGLLNSLIGEVLAARLLEPPEERFQEPGDDR